MIKRPLLVAAFALAGTAAAQTTVTWSYWGDPAELPPNLEVIKAFEAKYPNIKIRTQHAPWSGYFTQLDAQLAAKAGPDVMFLNNIPSYAARGVLEPLNAFVTESKFPVADYNAELMKIFSAGGKVYGFPRDNDTTVLYYNKDAFDQAKVAYPTASWRWNDLRAAAEKLTVRSGNRVTRYGLVLENNKWPVFVYQNGGRVFDDPLAPTRFLLGEPKAVEALQFIGDLINKYKVAPSFQEMAQIGDSTQLFAGGQAAMVMTNAARLPTFAKANFQWSVAPLPAGPTGLRANSLGGAGYVMNANSKNKAAAWTFLQFLAGPEGQAIFAKAGTAVPAMNRNERVAAAFTAPFKSVFLRETDNAKLLPTFPGYVRIRDTLLNPALDLVWNGEADAKTAIGRIVEPANALLKQK